MCAYLACTEKIQENFQYKSFAQHLLKYVTSYEHRQKLRLKNALETAAAQPFKHA